MNKSWHLSRRTLLRGVGAAVALPWLEAMAPAQERTARPPLRVAFIYHPIGAEATAWKGSSGAGRDFRLSTTLAALEPVKDSLLVLDGLHGRTHPPGGHMGASAPYLSSAPVGRGDAWGAETALTRQDLAERLSRDTPLRSLELSCNSIDTTCTRASTSPGAPPACRREWRPIRAKCSPACSVIRAATSTAAASSTWSATYARLAAASGPGRPAAAR
ncbi:MAG: DUF1552 domain-containing protein [Gemmataceae bacterium]